MKSTSIFSVLILLLALLIPAGVQADIDGFKGMRWGSNLVDLQQTKKLTLTKDGGKSGASLYALENEALRFGKATLTGIHCSFAKERLQGVILLFSGARNFTAVKAEAFAKFGETAKIDQNGEEMYNWPGTVTGVILSYNRSNQSGFVFMKAKKMPPPTKTTAKRNPAALTNQKEPSPPPIGFSPTRPAARPTTNPADLETALDRAPPLPQQPGRAQDITPEMQALIDRDQVLTQLCWETVGPAADAACVQMRQNVERLKTMGLCMQPGATGAPSGAAVIWRRCESATAVTPPPVTVTTNGPEPGQTLSPMDQATPQQTSQQTAPQTGENDPGHCRLIGELFASAAQMRDNGVEPQIAEQELTGQANNQTTGAPIERIRETIELVYFDQEYNSIGGDALTQRVSDRCLSGRGPFSRPMP
ncbi:MAG: hypothetical protein FWD79_10765 [Desulfobulbus sp.]|nr:hypothetical protein [Desulfobulbus sp.]